MSWQTLKDIVLTNERIILRRIRITDHDEFKKIVFDPEIWRYFVTQITNVDEFERFLEQSIQDTGNGVRIVFAIIDRRNNQIVGSTAYGNLSEVERKLEIGWSWLSAGARGTGINRAAKFALLDHAFNSLRCERVEFKTDVLNTVARAGLAGLGAKEEGILRSFNYMPGGRRRDVVYYSILRSEWPTLLAEQFFEKGKSYAV